jgi:hypothetical protein
MLDGFGYVHHFLLLMVFNLFDCSIYLQVCYLWSWLVGRLYFNLPHMRCHADCRLRERVNLETRYIRHSFFCCGPEH